MASKTSGMMFEHLEEYLMQSCKPECDQGELTDGGDNFVSLHTLRP